MIAAAPPAGPPTTSALLPDGVTTIQVSGFGDRMDWVPSPGNAEANAKFTFPCPVCGHGKTSHCEPYCPTPTTVVARCSMLVQVGFDRIGNPIMGRCNGGACIVPR